MNDFYDERGCPSCGRVVCMYGAAKCQTCTPQKQPTPNGKYEDDRTTAEVMSDFYKDGFC